MLIKINRSSKAQDFAKEWSGSDYKEKGNVGKFWIELLEQVFGVDNGAKAIDREVSVPNMNDSTDFIDAYIPATRVLIEQKAPYVDLSKKEKRSFGMVTPYKQAKHYDDNLPLS